MKHICLNLKRFDVPAESGGVNRIAPPGQWSSYIIDHTQEQLKWYERERVRFSMYFPEAHILGAVSARSEDSPVRIGCQGVFRENTSPGGNFGAFTTNCPASSARALGCETAIIGHCEERKDKTELISMGGQADPETVDRILNSEIRRAIETGMDVLYCIGEKAEEQAEWRKVLKRQLDAGLDGLDKNHVVAAYEPVWAIGPGKIPPDREYIRKIADYVKEVTGGIDVIYGGGLKAENAAMLASIPEIDGGLIALTRFTGEIGFYPDEYLDIIRIYMENCDKQAKA